MVFQKPKIIDRRKQALGYPGSGVYAKRNKSAIKQIVRHYTATMHEGSGANVIKKHERHWGGTLGWEIGGYHFFIDRQGVIYWNYDLEIVTYGAGKLNPQLVHFSMESNSVDNYTSAQLKSEKALILWLMQELNISANNVKGHKEIPDNKTSCPGYSVEQLQAYRNQLAKEYKAGQNNPAPVPTPKPKPKPTTKYTAGDYEFLTTIKVRKQADLAISNETGILYYPKEKVRVDRILEGKSYIWGTYINYYGGRSYIQLHDNIKNIAYVKKV